MPSEAAPELNGDLSVSVTIDTNEMEWAPSPSGTVWRKRLHRVGPAEAGRVTSVVRYEPESSFPPHDHPDGEEIFVLEGTFSDEHGDAPAGTHLLNPEGFRHTPFSREGCLIFVKLRQYSGPRKMLRTDTRKLPWRADEVAGVEVKTLYDEPGFDDRTRLERWAPGAAPGPRALPGGIEILVLEGALEDGEGRYPAGTWLRRPDAAHLDARSTEGCILYVKSGALSLAR